MSRMTIKGTLTFGAGIVVGVAVSSGLWLQADAQAQAPTKNTSKVVLENARVRVKEAVFYPGDKSPGMHTHELAHVGVIIEGGTLVFKSPDGKSETLNLTAGGVGYRDANVTHEPINTGTKPVKVIEVELK
jgi:mannose-6-phosphate isomerase-like protein (cupin superfamily)